MSLPDRMLERVFLTADRIFPPQVAHAHCDIPCGIYDKFPAILAAETVQKMVTQLLDLKEPAGADPGARLEFMNAVSRRVAIKEEHAGLCKKELLILWTDYFKAEHLRKFPDLHTKIWNGAKLCSENKQHIDPDLAKRLLDAVHEIGHMWDEAEKAKAVAPATR